MNTQCQPISVAKTKVRACLDQLFDRDQIVAYSRRSRLIKNKADRDHPIIARDNLHRLATQRCSEYSVTAATEHLHV